MQAIKENVVTIPGDSAMVGFNKDAICKIIEPKMTTINIPGIDIGEIAAHSLGNQLSGDSNKK